MSFSSAAVELIGHLNQLDRITLDDETSRRALGEAIVDLLTRLIGASHAAVWLGSVDSPPVLVAASPEWSPPEQIAEAGILDAEVAPIARDGWVFGAIAARGVDSEIGAALQDIAAPIAVMIANKRMAAQMREGDFQSKMQLLELESLHEIGLSIASTLNLDELSEEILMRTVTLLNARRAALYLRRARSFELHRSFGEVSREDLEELLSEESIAALVDENETLSDCREAVGVFPECQSAVMVPIRSERGTIGVLAAADREVRGGVGEFEKGDIRTLSLFASQAAIALENARLHHQALEKQAMERELQLAATIQQEILPHVRIDPDTGFETEVWMRSARQLGGDYHTVLVGDGSLSMCVADVSGKSTPAAILVSAFHAGLHLLFGEQRDLGEIATELNRHIHKWSSQNKFITLFLATVDRDAARVRYVNAGHNPGFLVRGGDISFLASNGMPIGIMPGSIYETQEEDFPPGSLLVLYSDGLTEAENTRDEEYGHDRLVALVRDNQNLGLVELRKAIMDAIDGFVGGAPQKDDQTILLLKTR